MAVVGGRRTVIISGGMVGLALFLSGCQAQSAPSVPESEFRLTPDTVAVVGYGPQVSDMATSGPGDHGYLLAISTDGKTQVLKTAPMTGMKPNWDGNAVYSRDPLHDRTTTADGTTSTTNEADILQGTVSTGVEGYTSIEEYDLGIMQGTDGMVEIRGRRTDGRVETAQFEGAILIPAACSDGLYGFSDLLSSREPKGSSQGKGTTLIREFPRPADTSDPRADVVAQAAQKDRGFLPTGLRGVCAGSTLYYLGQDSADPGDSLRAVAGLDDAAARVSSPRIRSWDTKTGTIRDIALTRTDGGPLATDYSETGAGAIVGNELYWYSPMGTVFASRLDTGATRTAFATEPKPINVGEDQDIDEISVVQFGDGKMYRLSSPTQGTAPGSLTSWDLASGKQELDVTVPATQEITGEARNLQIPWGVAIRPDLVTSGG